VPTVNLAPLELAPPTDHAHPVGRLTLSGGRRRLSATRSGIIKLKLKCTGAGRLTLNLAAAKTQRSITVRR
jgi:hypothetical protein